MNCDDAAKLIVGALIGNVTAPLLLLAYSNWKWKRSMRRSEREMAERAERRRKLREQYEGKTK